LLITEAGRLVAEAEPDLFGHLGEVHLLELELQPTGGDA